MLIHLFALCSIVIFRFKSSVSFKTTADETEKIDMQPNMFYNQQTIKMRLADMERMAAFQIDNSAKA